MSLLSGHEQRNKEFLDGTVARIAGLRPPSLRTLDKIAPKPRTMPMKVLCLGMPRTGTFSMHGALVRLGFRPYHMAEVCQNAPVAFPAWEDAYAAKKGVGPPLTKDDFDKLIGDCDCIEDAPCVFFADEFIKFYPDAKVVLTVRPVKDWIRSMSSTAMLIRSWKIWPYVSWADPELAGPFWHWASNNAFSEFFGDLSDTSAADSPDPIATHPHSPEAKYLRHYQHIREICPPDRLLEFELGDGYDKLCPFLGVETPDEAYPHVNEKSAFIGMHEAFVYRAAQMAVAKIAAVVVPVAAMAGVLWYRGGRLKP